MKNNTYKVSLGNGEDILLYDEVILKYNLLLKKEITTSELDALKKENASFSCYYKGIQYLAYKNRTKKEIREYLKKQGYSSNDIDNTIHLLEKKKIIDDEKYLEMYLHDQIHLTTNGPKKIKKKLMDLGFKQEIIEEQLTKIEDEIWNQKLEKIIAKKVMSNHKDGPSKIKEKIVAYCMNEGFAKEDILNSLEQMEIPNNDSVLEKEALKLYQKLSNKYQDNELIFQIKGRLLRKGFSYEEVANALESIKKSS